MKIEAGATSVSLFVYFVDDVGGTNPGEPTTGLLFSDIETGGSASYARQGAARVDLTLKTLSSASAAFDSGGFLLVDDTNMPGLYRVDYPDAAFATGADMVVIQMVAASGKNTVMRPLWVELGTVQTDLSNATDGLGAIKADTAVIGAAGAGLTDLGGMSTGMKAEVNAEADTALTDYDAVVPADLPTNFADLSITVTTGLVTLAAVTHTGAVIPTVTTLTGHTAQTGDSFARLGAAGAGLTDLGGMSTGMKAEVNTEVDGALDTAITELSQGVPTATPTVRTALMLLYMSLRNKLDVATSGTDTLEIHDDAGTRITQKLLTDDGSDYSEAKMISGV